MRPYREWLKADSFESVASLGGSLVGRTAEDYYFTPWDLDYGRLIRFDHDFIGREALAKMADQPHRRKVTLLWNPHDVLGVSASWLSDEPNAKFMEMPTAHYSTHPLDRILSNGREIGVSTYPVFTANEKSWLSLAVLSDEAPLGSEAIVVWGEPDGGSKKPVLERHSQRQIRATVHPWPYARQARQGYRPAGAVT